MSAPRLRVRTVALARRRIPFRLAFHVAGTVIDAVDHFYVRATIETEDGRIATGMTAEAPSPIWFDKVRPQAIVAADLQASLRHATERYRDEPRAHTAFGLFASAYEDQLAFTRARGAPDTIGSFGLALLDGAVLDALCRALGLSMFDAVRANAAGLDARLCADLAGMDLGRWLASLTPANRIAIRHTIGGDDPLTSRDVRRPIGDGLPETLEDIVRVYGNRYFKIKVGADIDAACARLRAIATVLDPLSPGWQASIDGNEAFNSAQAAGALVDAIAKDDTLASLRRGLLYIEQPIHRAHWRAQPVTAIAAPLIIDESDGTLDDFPAAQRLGYRGTSAKSCKGLYKTLLNAARCAQSGAFMAAEDLNHPAGLSLQQDLAVAALLGLEHIEKNGHHYMNGMAAAPAHEQQAFLKAHPDLYTEAHGAVRLKITDGSAAFGSLAGTGFAHAAAPDWRDLESIWTLDA